nr:hypothetical protein [Paracoccus fontiphilus]
MGLVTFSLISPRPPGSYDANDIVTYRENDRDINPAQQPHGDVAVFDIAFAGQPQKGMGEDLGRVDEVDAVFLKRRKALFLIPFEHGARLRVSQLNRDMSDRLFSA